MPVDSLFIYKSAKELNAQLEGGRIEKIMMPVFDELIMPVFIKKQFKLKINVSPSPIVCHTEESKENPLTPTGFCMHLRKHLLGGVIKKIEAYPFERVYVFTVENYSEMGDLQSYKLYAEIMGRNSNLVLVKNDGKISDCLKRTPIETGNLRVLMPGFLYSPPPPLNKLDIIAMKELLSLQDSTDAFKTREFFYNTALGFHPASIDEAILRAGYSDEKQTFNITESLKVVQNMHDLYYSASDAHVYYDKDAPRDVYCFKPSNLPADRLMPASDLNGAVTVLYNYKRSTINVADKKNSLMSKVRSQIAKKDKKLLLLSTKLRECAGADIQRKTGCLILSNLQNIEPRSGSIILTDYETGESITVALDTKLTPQANAQVYFKKYSKLKRGYDITNEQILQTQTEIFYFESLLDSIERAGNDEDFREVQQEMASCGLLPDPDKNKKKAKKQPPKYTKLQYKGFDIYIGRNNIQNDYVTNTLADNRDTWFHIKDAPGAHVILLTRSRAATDEAILYAATLAAVHSKARFSEKVEVDITLKKHVRKLNTSIGMVTYTNQRSMLVNPAAFLEKQGNI